MEKSKIILASGSPRRKELLLQIGIVPEIIVSHVEEKITSDVPAEVVMSLAEQNAGGNRDPWVRYGRRGGRKDPREAEEPRGGV